VFLSQSELCAHKQLLVPDSYPVAAVYIPFALEYGKAINARKAFGKEGEKVMSLGKSIDAPSTHQILPINHSADKRNDWVLVCLSTTYRAHLFTIDRFHSRGQQLRISWNKKFLDEKSFQSPQDFLG